MFKQGDIIVCIEPEGAELITKNKQYKVISLGKEFDNIVVIADDGYWGEYWEFRFISLQEYRKNKLKKICSKKEIK